MDPEALSDLGKRGWDADDPADVVRYLRSRLPYHVGCGPCRSDTGDHGICAYCGFFVSYKWGARLIRPVSEDPYEHRSECYWCAKRLGLDPWPENYRVTFLALYPHMRTTENP